MEIMQFELLKLLDGGNAHSKYATILKNFPIEKINIKSGHLEYTPYELLGHIVFTQKDIIKFTKNDNYKKLEWPKDYWPEKGKTATETEWKSKTEEFLNDLEIIKGFTKLTAEEILGPLFHAEKYTIFREILLTANHNAYHFGQLMLLSRI